MSTETTQLEVLESVENHALESIARAEIDVQISTAKRYPRTASKVKSDMMSFATLDEETAQACFYSLPRGGKNIVGPSVRLAEIAVSCYGNLRAGTRIIECVTTGDSPHVTIQSVCHDLQTNVAVTIEKRRRIVSKKDGRGGRNPIDEDDINLAANAGSAVAFRDAVFKVIPGALVKPVFEAAKRLATGDASSLVDRRAKMVAAFAKIGVSVERVLVSVEKRALEDIDLEDIANLTGLWNAIKDGATTIDDAFPDPKKEAPREPAINKKAEPTTPAQAATETPIADLRPQTPQAQLAVAVIGAGKTYADFAEHMAATDHISLENYPGFDDLPKQLAADCVKRLPKILQAMTGRVG